MGAILHRFYTWLDDVLFPRIVAYATHRLHIVWLLLLGVFLMVGGQWTNAELIGGNYTNITSALLACIILIQQAANHQEHKAMHRETHKRLDRIEAAQKANKRASKPTTSRPIDSGRG